MKVRVINLPRASERRRNVDRQLSSTPLWEAREFVEAVDGRALSPQERLRQFDMARFADAHFTLPSSGEIGCALSHYKCLGEIAADSGPSFVFEDDIIVTGPVEPLVALAEEWLAGCEPRALLAPTHCYYRHAEKADNYLTATPRRAHGTYCYAINPAGARLITSLGRPHYLADDWDYFMARGLRLKAVLEGPVTSDAGVQSTIDDHYEHRLDTEGIRRSANPDVFLFDYSLELFYTLLRSAGVMKKYVDPQFRELLRNHG